MGFTLKYSIGHGVAVARDQGSTIGADPLRVAMAFPVVHTDENTRDLNNGSGMGLDLGVQFKQGSLSLGASAQNVFTNFTWDQSRLVYRPASTLLEQGTSDSDFDAQPIGNAPQELLSAIDSMAFGRVVSVGAALDLGSVLTLSVDARKRLEDGMALGPESHVGAGASLRIVPFLHLQGGVAKITNAVQYSGGATLVLGPINLGFAAAVQRGEAMDGALAMVALSLGGH